MPECFIWHQGMLIQEYVLRTLKVQIPDGWEDMMRDTDSNEETTIEDGESIVVKC